VLLLAGSAAARADVTILEPSALDRAYLVQQSAHIDELAARRLGQRLQHTSADLPTLQAILDRQLIKADDEAGLQAMGIALGEILASELNLEWVIYLDDKGRSRALAIDRTQQYLFPATMISRRARVGLAVDVNQLYAKAQRSVKAARATGLKTY
jgi:hypothetical protein